MICNLAKASYINLFWSYEITSSGGVSKFKILLSKKTTFWIKGILKFNPGFEIILLGSPNWRTIAWLTSLTINIEKVIIEKNAGSGVVPYLPLPELSKKKATN